MGMGLGSWIQSELWLRSLQSLEKTTQDAGQGGRGEGLGPWCAGGWVAALPCHCHVSFHIGPLLGDVFEFLPLKNGNFGAYVRKGGPEEASARRAETRPDDGA